MFQKWPNKLAPAKLSQPSRSRCKPTQKTCSKRCDDWRDETDPHLVHKNIFGIVLHHFIFFFWFLVSPSSFLIFLSNDFFCRRRILQAWNMNYSAILFFFFFCSATKVFSLFLLRTCWKLSTFGLYLLFSIYIVFGGVVGGEKKGCEWNYLWPGWRFY